MTGNDVLMTGNDVLMSISSSRKLPGYASAGRPKNGSEPSDNPTVNADLLHSRPISRQPGCPRGDSRLSLSASRQVWSWLIRMKSAVLKL